MNSLVSIDPPVPLEKRTSRPIPLSSGTVQAGFPSPADDYAEKSIDLNEQLVRNPTSTFFVRARGDSMKDAGITSGDILVVDKSIPAANRHIVVAMLDGDFTVKRLRRRNNRVFLESGNQEFPPREITPDQELVIWGVVTFVIHQPK